jgi:hypothetical protein
VDLTAAIERRPRRRPRDQELTGALCVARGIVPLAPQLHDFGAVVQTLAAIAHEIGLRRAPLRKRGRPFIRAPHIERLLTILQHAAADISGYERGHLAGDHRSHRFIEERDTFGNASQADERATASVAGHRRRIAICKSGERSLPPTRRIPSASSKDRRALKPFLTPFGSMHRSKRLARMPDERRNRHAGRAAAGCDSRIRPDGGRSTGRDRQLR